MFDDPQQSGHGTPPPNLPIGEPEDIFSRVEPSSEVEEDAVPEKSPAMDVSVFEASAVASPSPLFSSMPADLSPDATSSALAAGILRPKAPSVQNDEIPTLGGAASSEQMYKVQGPSFIKNALVFLVVIVLVGVAIFGGYWAYGAFIKDKISAKPSSDSLESKEDADTFIGQTEEATADEQILFGEIVDSDADGLDNEEERGIGTDAHNWDTDSDGLSDYDEVKVWKTDPFLADTDGDGYLDGSEVKSGYSPTGPGKIFEVPTDETAISSGGSITREASSPSDPRVRPADSTGSFNKLAPPQTVIQGDGIDCAGDAACFIAAANTCTKAVHKRLTTIDLWDSLGVRQNVTHLVQILGPKDQGLCQLYMRLDDIIVTFKDDVPAEIQSENRQLLESTIGKDGTCTMAPNKIGDLFVRWGQGALTATDLSSGECSGSLFSTAS